MEKDNHHLDRTPAQKGQKDDKKIEFQCQNAKGNFVTYRFPKAEEYKWDDIEWIARLNRWRLRTFRRVFKGDPDFSWGPTRPRWSQVEFEAFKTRLLAHIQETHRKPTRMDFIDISRYHNARWANTVNSIGTLMHNAPVLSKQQAWSPRTAKGMQELWLHSKELLKEVEALLTAKAWLVDSGDQKENNQENADDKNIEDGDFGMSS